MTTISLRNSLRANAAFSIFSALSLIIFTEQLSGLLGNINMFYLQILAGGLFGFVAQLLFVSEKTPLNLTFARAIIFMDIAWVIGSTIIIAAFYNQLSVLGIALIIAVALVVAILAYIQNKGINTAHNEI